MRYSPNLLCRVIGKLIFLILSFVISASPHAAEFEVMDKLVVGGPSTFRSSATIVVSTVQSASLWASTSVVTPHLYISTTGMIGVGTAAPQSSWATAGA